MSRFLWSGIATLLMLSSLAAQSGPSLFSDIKGHAVGDILSVMIVESADASRQSASNSSASTDLSMNGSLGGDITDKLPSFGLNTGSSNSFDGRDATSQRERLTGRISVRIIEALDNGIFRVEGERKLSVNGEDNLMKLSGFVRARDISASNTVYSYHVADAQITYRKAGLLNGMAGQGFFSRWTTRSLGVLLLLVGMGTVTFTTVAQ